MKAVIMCGGIGSRLRPLTESQPKPLLKLLNRPVIDIIIEKLISSGINEIYISLGYMAQEIIDYCESKNYDAHIIFREEEFPLGTAGGVKNCISVSDDDILVVSGDNVFDFDLEKLSNYHFASESDITVCGVSVSDPREYGVIIKDDDGSVVSFVEKPTWEQAESFLANTGIYLLKGEILDMIPKGCCYDFSNDLFPEIFKSEKRFMCYHTDGFWGDMGEFEAYLDVSCKLLDNKYEGFGFMGNYVTSDTHLNNDILIKAPCLIGENVDIGNSTVIGPYTVIGNNCRIDKNCVIKQSLVGEACSIGENCDINKAFLSDMVILKDNCDIDENSVLGYGCNIGRFSRILNNCKIWPGRRIFKESVISDDMQYETPDRIEFDIFGLSGRINSQLTVSDAVKLGQAISGIKKEMKIGLGCDEKICSSVYKSLCASGIRTCAGIVYDFGESAKVMSYFYSAYCNLDMYIYISANGDVLNFSFFGENGMPVNASVARKINNNFRFSSYDFCSVQEYKEVFNMSLFSTVYKTYFNKMLGEYELPFNVIVESENKFLKNLLAEIFAKRNTPEIRDSIQLLINIDGTDVYIVENDKLYSTERILMFLCEMAFASNRDVLIPEDAPDMIEEKAKIYKRHAIRQYAGAKSGLKYPNDIVLDNIWCFDPIMMCARMLNVVAVSKESFAELFEFQGDITLRKSVIEYEGSPGKIRKIIENSGAEKYDETYYVIANRKGKARIRQLGNSSRIRVLAEAADMEAAKELSVFVAEKIKNGDIDKV